MLTPDAAAALAAEMTAERDRKNPAFMAYKTNRAGWFTNFHVAGYYSYWRADEAEAHWAETPERIRGPTTAIYCKLVPEPIEFVPTHQVAYARLHQRRTDIMTAISERLAAELPDWFGAKVRYWPDYNSLRAIGGNQHDTRERRLEPEYPYLPKYGPAAKGISDNKLCVEYTTVVNTGDGALDTNLTGIVVFSPRYQAKRDTILPPVDEALVKAMDLENKIMGIIESVLDTFAVSSAAEAAAWAAAGME